jgi:hypothetical protein
MKVVGRRVGSTEVWATLEDPEVPVFITSMI